MELVPTIGLEIHAELKTRTKMFCDSPNEPEGVGPNQNICPICLAHPGTLPVINKEAVRSVLRVGKAIGARLCSYTEFDRKNYFYPDLPKGYQISQYAFPLVTGGVLNGISVTRIHLEEDTARSQHDPVLGATLIDFNRAGVPLMELVTEPVIHSAKQAGDFARELQLLLRYLGVSDANMEKGEMRVEANISMAPPGQLGTKVEVKNLNSFRSMERAVEFELKRQEAVLVAGGAVTQETRGWDEARQETFAQRVKEGSADYRYFPDPDLPKLVRDETEGFSDVELAASLPELPQERRARYVEIGIATTDADTLVRDVELGGLLDDVVINAEGDAEVVLLAANYIISDLVKIIRDSDGRVLKNKGEGTVTGKSMHRLMRMIRDGDLSSRGAKDVLALMAVHGGNPEVIAKEAGLVQKSDPAELRPSVQAVLDAHPEVVSEFRLGKDKSLQFLVGQAMKATKGAANPKVLQALLREMAGTT